jgi:hypothetical protein
MDIIGLRVDTIVNAVSIDGEGASAARKFLRPAHRIHQFHPLEIRAHQIEQGWRAEDHRQASRPRERDIQAISGE